MATRSWLAKAKSIHDLGAHFYVPKSKHSWVEEREDKAEDKWLERLQRPKPVAEKWLPFFGSRMHDSWVMGVERNADEVRVRLDCIHADIFAIGLAEVLVIDRIRRQWPVDLVFHQPHHLRAARHLPSGGLRFYDVRRLYSTGPQEGPQFLHDWFFDEDDRIQWISEIWNWESNSKESKSIYLMIDCERVSVVDRRAKVLASVFGPAVLSLWSDALAGVGADEERNDIWHLRGMEPYLRRRIAHHALKRADFHV